MVWTSIQLTTRKYPVTSIPSSQGKDHTIPPIYLLSFLPSKWFLPYYYHNSTLQMSAHHSTRLHSPLKKVLGKIRDRYQAYCTTYKMHTMATHHGGKGHPLNRGLDTLIEDLECADYNNESTHSSDATIVLGAPEAVGHPKDPVYSNQDKLTELTREINDLHQWVVAGEGQLARDLGSHIVWTSKFLDSTPSATSTHTCWTIQRSNKAIHRYLVHHTEAVKFHEVITAGYICFQRTWLYQAGRLAHGHWDGSRSHH